LTGPARGGRPEPIRIARFGHEVPTWWGAHSTGALVGSGRGELHGRGRVPGASGRGARWAFAGSRLRARGPGREGRSARGFGAGAIWFRPGSGRDRHKPTIWSRARARAVVFVSPGEQDSAKWTRRPLVCRVRVAKPTQNQRRS